MIGFSLYERKWELQILCEDGTLNIIKSDGFGDEGPKCTFNINYPGFEEFYISEFVLYNLKAETLQKIIKEGSQVMFSAGYADGLYGQIFGGQVFQSLIDRENVTDYKVTLRCIDGYRVFCDNFVIKSLVEYTDATMTNAIAAYSTSTIPLGKVTSEVSTKKYPRGATIFARSAVPLREIIRNSGSVMYMSNGKLQVSHYSDIPLRTTIDINPKSGLIGTPQQIEFGVSFRTLLNPMLILDNPPRVVKLDLSGINIQQQAAQPGKNIVAKLPKDGLFKIGGVRHFGDTRGNEWYTDIVGYSMTGKAGLQLGIATEKSIPEMIPRMGWNNR